MDKTVSNKKSKDMIQEINAGSPPTSNLHKSSNIKVDSTTGTLYLNINFASNLIIWEDRELGINWARMDPKHDRN